MLFSKEVFHKTLNCFYLRNLQVIIPYKDYPLVKVSSFFLKLEGEVRWGEGGGLGGGGGEGQEKGEYVSPVGALIISLSLIHTSEECHKQIS